MGILRVISKSLRESFRPKRFLPFFLLYLLTSIAFIILIFPVIKALPSMILGFSVLSTILPILLLLCAVFLIVLLLNLWFTGALIHNAISNKTFGKSLQYSKKVFWQILILSFVIFLLNMFSFLLGFFSFIAQLLIGLIFFYSLPALVIKKYTFDEAMKKSFDVVRRNVLKTIAFIISTRIVILVMILVSFFSIMLTLLPVFQDTLPIKDMVLIQVAMSELVNIILKNYPLLLLTSVVASFFFAIIHVFDYLSRTYYFLELKKKD